MLKIYDVPIEQRLRLAICILSYAAIKTGRLQYTDSWYVPFLTGMARSSSEKMPEIRSESNPAICIHCGKIVGTHIAHASIVRPEYKEDCCYNKGRYLSPSTVRSFTTVQILPITDIISYYMNVTHSVVNHYATLEAMKYFARKEQKLNELSRYYVKPALSERFEPINSLE